MEGRPIRLVIADDDQDNRRLAVLLFGGLADFAVLGEAADMIAAADLVERHRPDVVLLDCSMPNMTGPEAIVALRRRSPATAVVVVSGYRKGDPEVTWLSGQVDDYIEKGTSPARLVAAVRAAAAKMGSAHGAASTLHGAASKTPADDGEASACGEASARPPPPVGKHRSPSLAEVAEALHDGPVQGLSGALWTLDALEAALGDTERSQELLARLRTTLRSALEATRAVSRSAKGDDDP